MRFGGGDGPVTVGVTAVPVTIFQRSPLRFRERPRRPIHVEWDRIPIMGDNADACVAGNPGDRVAV